MIKLNPLAQRPKYQRSSEIKHCREFMPQNADELHASAAILFEHRHSVGGGVKVVENRRFEIPFMLNGSNQQKADRNTCRPWHWAGRGGFGFSLGLIFHAVAGAFQEDRLGVVEQPVQDG